MKSPEEVKEYINSHCFENKYHAQCVRALILWEYGRVKELKEVLMLRTSINKSVSLGLPIITANDAINFITQ